MPSAHLILGRFEHGSGDGVKRLQYLKLPPGCLMEIRTSIPRTLGLMAFLVVIALICYVGARDDSALVVIRVCAWSGVFFCICILVFYLFQLFRRSPTVVIDDSGVFDRRLGVGTIAWEDISRAAVTRLFGSQRCISLWLRNEEHYLSRLSAQRAWLMQVGNPGGASPFRIQFAGLTPRLDEAYELLRSRLPEGTAL